MLPGNSFLVLVIRPTPFGGGGRAWSLTSGTKNRYALHPWIETQRNRNVMMIRDYNAGQHWEAKVDLFFATPHALNELLHLKQACAEGGG